MCRTVFAICFLALASPAAAQRLSASTAQDPALLPTPDADGGSLEFQGRIGADWTSFFGEEDVTPHSGSFSDGGELRRARLGFTGDAIDSVVFKASFDLTFEDAEVRDLWLRIQDLGTLGSLTLGHLKEPFGLERSTAGTTLLFLERSPAAALTPSRNLGLAFHDTLLDQRATWAAGVFREPGSLRSPFGDEFGLSARFTCLPWYEEDGERLLHLGFGYSRRQPSDGLLSLSEGLPLHRSPTMVDSGDIPTDALSLMSVELGANLGAWNLQGEWITTAVDVTAAPNEVLPGYFLQASWLLTGERRSYRRSRGRFGAPELPSAIRSGNPIAGAWELAVRTSKLDLDSGSIQGGVLRGRSIGLNWYLSDSFKAQLDYEFARLQSVGGAHGLALRIEFQW